MFFLRQLLSFSYQQALSCIFPALIFLTLAVSKEIEMPWIHRYDFILLVCIVVQFGMLYTGMETKDELKVVMVFHLIGLLLELYKVHMGSWAYPEEAWTKVLGVPLYSGFMYASVASYLCQAWRRFHLRICHWPRWMVNVLLGAAIYLNFFTHHYLYDFRWVLTALIFVVYFKTYVTYHLNGITYRMPMALSYLLIGFFIWVAENIATFFGAWQYPDQQKTWNWVGVEKISSWFLLVIISVIIVAQLKHIKESLTNKSLEGPENQVSEKTTFYS
ncbi:DUF817 domain-containing protein [Salinithrix halophila]|uniref:DUF817 domain-containing protein n=1 Tax=Salinithrix halophila TaxID=1485204 RepID=A0ABV8JIL1_9BACL